MNDEKKTEKKTLKERLAEKKAKAESWVADNKEAISFFIPLTGAAILGVVGHIIYDDIKNGGKTISWYDHYSGKEGCPEIITFTKTPTIRDIKNGKIDSKWNEMCFDKEVVEKMDEEYGWKKG